MQFNYLWIILFVVVVIGIGIIVEIRNRRCPACGKGNARKIVKSTRHADFESYGQQHVHTTSTHTCVCKFCGHEWTQKYRSTKSRK